MTFTVYIKILLDVSLIKCFTGGKNDGRASFFSGAFHRINCISCADGHFNFVGTLAGDSRMQAPELTTDRTNNNKLRKLLLR